MKYLSLLSLCLLFCCGKKEDVLLPKSNRTVVGEVIDHSSIYIFFKTKDQDTLADLNRKNSIISTNWILHIDKRLPLRLVIPEVMRLQQKKREEKEHVNQAAQNYYSYADSIGKNLAFLPFTKVYYKLEKPKSGLIIFFNGKSQIIVNNKVVKQEGLLRYFNKSQEVPTVKPVLCFDKKLSFGSYIQYKVLIDSLKFSNPEIEVSDKEFVF